MTWYYVPGIGPVDDMAENAYIPWDVQGVQQMPLYRNPGQFGDSEPFPWLPGAWTQEWLPGLSSYAVGYIPGLIDAGAAARAGTMLPFEREQYDQQVAAARAIPMRDWTQLQAGYPGEGGDWSRYLTPSSPDAGAIMLALDERVRGGWATGQERQLYTTFLAQMREQDYRANVPQASDAFSIWGNDLLGPMSIVALGATGGLAAAPLAAGAGLTLGSAAGLAGTAGTLTGMMGQALDEPWLQRAALALGVAGGAAGLGQMLQTGLTSVGDVLGAVQKTYGVGSKMYQLIAAGPQDPAQAGLQNPAERLYSLDPSYQSNELVRTQRQALQAGDGTTGAGSTGGSMSEQTMGIEQLGGVLAGIIGLAGSGLSLADVKRYLDQMSQVYAGQTGVRDLIDRAYTLASERVNIQQAQNQEGYAKSVEAYNRNLERFNQTYADERSVFQQQQEAYGLQQQQIAADRQRIETLSGEDRQRAIEAYQRRVQESEHDRAFKRGIFSDDRARFLAAYEQQKREAAEERQLDLQGYMQRQAIGAGLRDPNAIVAGARGIYQPLSDLAREMISRNTQGEMAMRGVSPEGQYANIMSARAFAPLEQQMWQNALQQWLGAQQTAIGAYGPVNLASTPTYAPLQQPDFALSPDYQYQQIQVGPRTDPRLVPDVSQTRYFREPAYPGAPGAINPPTSILDTNFWPKPGEPFGTTAATGGGRTGPLAELGGVVGDLSRILQKGGGMSGLIGGLAKLLGLGGSGYSVNPTMYSEPIGPGLGWDASGYINPQQYSEPIGPGLGWDSGGYSTGYYGGDSYGYDFPGWGESGADLYGPYYGDFSYSGDIPGW